MVTILFLFLCRWENMSSLFILLSTIHSTIILPSIHLSIDSPNLSAGLSHSVSSYRLIIQAVFLNNLKSHRPYPDFGVDYLIHFL